MTAEHNGRGWKWVSPDNMVHHLWFFETDLVDVITFMATTSCIKKPGEVNDSSSIGNDNFDAGLKGCEFGYAIIQCYQFTDPLNCKALKGKYDLILPISHFVPYGYPMITDYIAEKILTCM